MGIPVEGWKREKVQVVDGSGSFLGEVDVDVDGAGDLEHGDVFDLRGGADDVDVSFVYRHLEVVPGLGALPARRPSAADPQMLVRQSDGTTDGGVVLLGVLHEVLGDHLDLRELIARERDPRLSGFVAFEHILLRLFVSHNIEYLIDYF